MAGRASDIRRRFGKSDRPFRRGQASMTLPGWGSGEGAIFFAGVLESGFRETKSISASR